MAGLLAVLMASFPMNYPRTTQVFHKGQRNLRYLRMRLVGKMFGGFNFEVKLCRELQLFCYKAVTGRKGFDFGCGGQATAEDSTDLARWFRERSKQLREARLDLSTGYPHRRAVHRPIGQLLTATNIVKKRTSSLHKSLIIQIINNGSFAAKILNPELPVWKGPYNEKSGHLNR